MSSTDVYGEQTGIHFYWHNVNISGVARNLQRGPMVVVRGGKEVEFCNFSIKITHFYA